MRMLSRVMVAICRLMVAISVIILIAYLAEFSGIYWGMPIAKLWDCIPLFTLCLAGALAAISLLVGILRAVDHIIDPYDY